MTISAVYLRVRLMEEKMVFFLHSYLPETWVRYVPILGRLLFLYLTSKSVGYLFMDKISKFYPSSSGGMSGNSIPPNSDSTIFAAGGTARDENFGYQETREDLCKREYSYYIL